MWGPQHLHADVVSIFPHLSSSWLNCYYPTFSTVFQSYRDNGRVLMKGCVQWDLIYSWEDFCLQQGLSPDCMAECNRTLFIVGKISAYSGA